MVNMSMLMIVSLVVILVTMAGGQPPSPPPMDRRHLDQQIIQSIPKLNLANFGIEIKSTKLATTTSTMEHRKSPPVEYPAEAAAAMKEARLREIEWEYHDRERTRPATTTTTTSVPPLFESYSPRWRWSSEVPVKNPITAAAATVTTTTTTTTTTTAPPDIPFPDCERLCVPRHFLQHYHQRGCRPVFSRDCDCAKRYRCPGGTDADHQNDDGYCVIPDARGDDHQRYPIGSIVPVPNEPCRVCRCRADLAVGGNMAAKIECSLAVDCPELGRVSSPDCYYAYSHERCCGTEICPDQLKRNDLRLRTRCRYRGRTYRYGEPIELKENLCKHCICNEHWNEYDPDSSASCTERICPVDRRHQHRCLPIYHRDRCCPVDYICDTGTGNFTAGTKLVLTNGDATTHKDNRHRYCGMTGTSNAPRYRLGASVHFTKDSTLNGWICAKCRCQVPPLMSCYANDDCLILNF